jgi:O-acetyl-ADP-ribose deacetylase (regulator of RNase III)
MSRVFIVKGNLLESDCNVIIHQANCYATMGAGIAKQIVNLYPAVLDADRQYHLPVGSRDRLGHTSHAWVNGPHGRLLVVNLYGQHRYGKGLMTEYEAFKRGLRSILHRLKKVKGEHKIGLPFGVGCGLAGGKWDVVFEIIKDAAREFDRDIYLYKL